MRGDRAGMCLFWKNREEKIVSGYPGAGRRGVLPLAAGGCGCALLAIDRVGMSSGVAAGSVVVGVA
jgi:hypothetical protein